MTLLIGSLVRYNISYLAVPTTVWHKRESFELAFFHTRRWILTASVRHLLCFAHRLRLQRKI